MTPAPAPEPATVVLLHGLALRGWSMQRLAWALTRAGYRVVNLTYASRTMPLDQLARDWLPTRWREHGLDQAAHVHIITHSMGGILVRAWLAARGGPPAQLRRVVMIAPPNEGTPVVDRMRHWWLFRAIMHDNGTRLGTGPDSLPRRLGPWPEGAQLGVIAGNKFPPLLFARWMKGEHDGKVPVASTRLDGMSDHIVVPYTHTLILYHRPVIDQALTFLRSGQFLRP